MNSDLIMPTNCKYKINKVQQHVVLIIQANEYFIEAIQQYMQSYFSNCIHIETYHHKLCYENNRFVFVYFFYSLHNMTWYDCHRHIKGTLICQLIFFEHQSYFKAYIPLGLFLALRWQLSPTQVKCTCNANDSTYIPLGFSIKLRIIRGSVSGICNNF